MVIRRVVGKVCDKHPELAGERYRNAKGNAGSCVGCSREAATARSQRITQGDRAIRELAELKNAMPDLVAVVELKRNNTALLEQNVELMRSHKRLSRRLAMVRAAGMRVYRSRGKGDDRTGDPRHAHTKLGHWDKDGSVCKSCAAWEKLKELCK